MCVKLPPRDLNSGPYPAHPIGIYTCEVTTTPRIRGDVYIYIYSLFSSVHLPFKPAMYLHNEQETKIDDV